MDLIELQKMLPAETAAIVGAMNMKKQYETVIEAQTDALAAFVEKNRGLIGKSEDSIRQTIATAIGGGKAGKNFRANRPEQVRDLSRAGGVDFDFETEKLWTKNAFKRENTQGSRNTNLYKGLFGIGGAIAGYSSSDSLSASTGWGSAGLVIGACVDKYGANAGRILLKSYLTGEMLAKTTIGPGGTARLIMDRYAAKNVPFFIEKGTDLFNQVKQTVMTDKSMSAMDRVAALRDMDENGIAIPSLSGIKDALEAQNKSAPGPTKSGLERLSGGH
jgi:hypothetical protein